MTFTNQHYDMFAWQVHLHMRGVCRWRQFWPFCALALQCTSPGRFICTCEGCADAYAQWTSTNPNCHDIWIICGNSNRHTLSS